MMMEKNNKSGRLLSVNWQDGMLVKSSHFDEQESYFENLISWMIRSSALFYGLIRPAEISGHSFGIRLDHDGQNWVVVLSQCYGITAGGNIIQIDSAYDNSIKTKPIKPEGANNIPVYVYADGSKKNLGIPSETGMLTRAPYRCYDYKLLAGELTDINPADCLKVAEIVIEQNSPRLSEAFIPPCTLINAHPVLSDYSFKLKGLLTQARQSALNGYQAFVSLSEGEGGKFGQEHKLLQQILSELSIKFGAKLKIHPRPDIAVTSQDLFSFYQEIFGTVESMLETYGEISIILNKKFSNNELYTRFISELSGFTNSKYNHQELGKSLRSLILLANDFVEFVNLIAGLAGVLPKTGKVLHYRQKEYMLQNFGSVTTRQERDGLSIQISGLDNIVSRDIVVAIRKELFGEADHRYIMVKIGVNENNVPGRMAPVNVDAEVSPENLVFKPMDDLKSQSLNAINLNLRGNFNPQTLTELNTDSLAVFVY